MSSPDMHIDPRISKINNCIYRVSVKALVVNDGKVLLVKEDDDDFWDIPGGGLDHGESLNEALIREVTEELGVPTDKIKTDYELAFASTGIIKGMPKINLFYLVSVPPDEIRPTQCVAEHGWFTPEKVQKLYINPSVGDIKEWITK